MTEAQLYEIIARHDGKVTAVKLNDYAWERLFADSIQRAHPSSAMQMKIYRQVGAFRFYGPRGCVDVSRVMPNGSHSHIVKVPDVVVMDCSNVIETIVDLPAPPPSEDMATEGNRDGIE